jgi:Gylcosyl hydrolase family 115 C-terminal domain
MGITAEPIAFDDQPPQTVDILASNSQTDWETAVKDSVRKTQSTHALGTSGYHVLKIWMVDPGVVLQKDCCEYRRIETQLPRPAGKLSPRSQAITSQCSESVGAREAGIFPTRLSSAFSWSSRTLRSSSSASAVFPIAWYKRPNW